MTEQVVQQRVDFEKCLRVHVKPTSSRHLFAEHHVCRNFCVDVGQGADLLKRRSADIFAAEQPRRFSDRNRGLDVPGVPTMKVAVRMRMPTKSANVFSAMASIR